MRARLFLILLLLLPIPLLALDAGEALSDPALEARAVAIGEQLRCVVCQSESINDSPAGLAKDLRGLVRDKLKAGLSDQQVIDFVHQRYGDYVLLKPPVTDHTLVLWLAPWVLLGVGFGLFALIVLNKTNWHKD